jgi:hypothetical protein
MSTELKTAATEHEAPERPTRRRVWVPATLIAVALAFLAGIPGGSDTAVLPIHDEVDRLVVITKGQVEVTVGEEIEVAITREWGWLPHPEVSIGVEAGVLEVDGRCGYPWILDSGCTTKVAATVLADTFVEVRSGTGGITVSDVKAGVDLTTSAGGIEVQNVAGPAQLRTSAGGITGVINGGEIEATTAAGGITLDVTGSLESLSAVTSAGAVKLRVPDDVYDVDFNTAAGSVDLDVRMDPDSDRSIVARTSAGSIEIERFGEGP